MVVRELPTDLGDRPTEVVFPVGVARAKVLDVARDPKQALVLRVEGISIDRQPGVVYEVLVNGTSIGVLSFYGAEESNGQFAASFQVDRAVQAALQEKAGDLRVTFVPRSSVDQQGHESPIKLTGHAKFARLRLTAE